MIISPTIQVRGVVTTMIGGSETTIVKDAGEALSEIGMAGGTIGSDEVILCPPPGTVIVMSSIDGGEMMNGGRRVTGEGERMIDEDSMTEGGGRTTGNGGLSMIMTMRDGEDGDATTIVMDVTTAAEGMIVTTGGREMTGKIIVGGGGIGVIATQGPMTVEIVAVHGRMTGTIRGEIRSGGMTMGGPGKTMIDDVTAVNALQRGNVIVSDSESGAGVAVPVKSVRGRNTAASPNAVARLIGHQVPLEARRPRPRPRPPPPAPLPSHLVHGPTPRLHLTQRRERQELLLVL